MAGEFAFFTRGADRTTTRVKSALAATVFGQRINCGCRFSSFQQRLATFVNGNNGRARIDDAKSDRYDRPTVQATYHDPSVPWAD